jgi:hypothetical protein
MDCIGANPMTVAYRCVQSVYSAHEQSVYTESTPMCMCAVLGAVRKRTCAIKYADVSMSVCMILNCATPPRRIAWHRWRPIGSPAPALVATAAERSLVGRVPRRKHTGRFDRRVSQRKGKERGQRTSVHTQGHQRAESDACKYDSICQVRCRSRCDGARELWQSNGFTQTMSPDRPPMQPTVGQRESGVRRQGALTCLRSADQRLPDPKEPILAHLPARSDGLNVRARARCAAHTRGRLQAGTTDGGSRQTGPTVPDRNIRAA